MLEKPFKAGDIVRCKRANNACGLLVEGAIYTVVTAGDGSGSLELKEVPFPNTRGVKFWDHERFDPYSPMDSTEYDDTLAGQAILEGLERGK